MVDTPTVDTWKGVPQLNKENPVQTKGCWVPCSFRGTSWTWIESSPRRDSYLQSSKECQSLTAGAQKHELPNQIHQHWFQKLCPDFVCATIATPISFLYDTHIFLVESLLIQTTCFWQGFQLRCIHLSSFLAPNDPWKKRKPVSKFWVLPTYPPTWRCIDVHTHLEFYESPRPCVYEIATVVLNCSRKVTGGPLSVATKTLKWSVNLMLKLSHLKFCSRLFQVLFWGLCRFAAELLFSLEIMLLSASSLTLRPGRKYTIIHKQIKQPVSSPTP